MRKLIHVPTLNLCTTQQLHCFTRTLRSFYDECHAHESDCRCNGKRTNKAKKKADEASKTKKNLKQWRHHYSPLNLEWDKTRSHYEFDNFKTSGKQPNDQLMLVFHARRRGIQQIDPVCQCVCNLMMHGWRKNVVTTKKHVIDVLNTFWRPPCVLC